MLAQLRHRKVMKILGIACLCTLHEFSDEWNEEEPLESLFTLLTLLLSLLTILLTINSGLIRGSPFNLSSPCDVVVELRCSQVFLT